METYPRTITNFTVKAIYPAKKLGDGSKLINIDLVNENGEKVHTVAYQTTSDVAGVDDMVEYLEQFPMEKGTKVLAKVVTTNNPTTKMLTYLSYAIVGM